MQGEQTQSVDKSTSLYLHSGLVVVHFIVALASDRVVPLRDKNIHLAF